MSALEQQLRDSILNEQIKKLNRTGQNASAAMKVAAEAIVHLTNENETLRNENSLLKARLKIVDLRAAKREELPGLLRPQAE